MLSLTGCPSLGFDQVSGRIVVTGLNARALFTAGTLGERLAARRVRPFPLLGQAEAAEDPAREVLSLPGTWSTRPRRLRQS